MVARKPTDVVQVNLRLRESLRRKLERESERRGVSFNAELTRRLEESFDREELNEALRGVIRQVLTEGDFTEALKRSVAGMLGELNLTDGFASGHTGEALREIQTRREPKNTPESKS
jgi:hypothetical protein